MQIYMYACMHVVYNFSFVLITVIMIYDFMGAFQEKQEENQTKLNL